VNFSEEDIDEGVDGMERKIEGQLVRNNSLEEHCASVNVVPLQWKETVHVTSRLEEFGSIVCELSSVVCGAALMGARLDPTEVLLARQGPSGCEVAPALRYVQVAEPEPENQVV